MSKLAVLTALGFLLCAAPAAADSLVFIKGHNIWLSQPDGSGQYQVTLDGTAAAPYESPSQADNGTIVAIRQTPGQRPQLYRMSQSGGLLNAPINTPAPGTGAMHAKVSPNGALVAYWFLTLVNDPLCPFCVNIANQALLSHSDRFTNHTEVGTPNYGGWPSWIGSDTIVIGGGTSAQWYYRLGMPEAAQWFADNLFVDMGFQTLMEAEAGPAGDRIAVVRGNNQETIAFLKMNGPPPAMPSVANFSCYAPIANPTGKFTDLTWSSDGRLLAWQEGDGVWTGNIPADLADCAGFGSYTLRIPGATEPDLSPAPVNPGARPPCGNPGNPSCQPVCAKPGDTPPCDDRVCCARRPIRDELRAVLGTSLGKLGIRGLLRKRRFSVVFDAPGPGALGVQLTARAASASRVTVLAKGRRVFVAAGRGTVKVKLTRAGAKRLRGARRLRVTLKGTFTPRGGRPVVVKRGGRLKR